MPTSRTRTERTRVIGRRKYTAEEREAIFRSCPVTTLAEVFRMKRQNVERRLSGCPVAAIDPDGLPLYEIAEAAKFLVRVKLTEKQIHQTLVRMDPRDFPPMLNKMFWEAMITRRKSEEQVGDLWHSSDVVKVAADSFNAIRMSLLLLPDELTETAGLNEQQRVIVRDMIDNALESCENALITQLRKPGGPGPGTPSSEGDL